MCITGTPNWALTVKDYRANFVHAPFPEILSSRARGFEARGAVSAARASSPQPCEPTPQRQAVQQEIRS